MGDVVAAAFVGVKKDLLLYLANGCSQAQAAAAVGVSEGYVSQLLTDDKEFAAAVASHKNERLGQQVKMGEIADNTQLIALERLAVAARFESKVGNLLSIVKTLDGMQRRGITSQQSQQQEQGLVRVRLSPLVGMVPLTLEVDITNTVIQAGDSTMVPANMKVIDALVTECGDERTRETGALPGAGA